MKFGAGVVEIGENERGQGTVLKWVNVTLLLLPGPLDSCAACPRAEGKSASWSQRHPERWQGALWRHVRAREEGAETLGSFWAPGQAGIERCP